MVPCIPECRNVLGPKSPRNEMSRDKISGDEKS
jgi:hypothetical protein